MKLRLTFALACAALPVVRCPGQPIYDIPHLQKQGTASQLIVDGRPFLALAGELGNNTSSSLETMQPVWRTLVSGNLNCVLAGLSWAQMEPLEGKYEFAMVDGLLQESRRSNLKLVLLWFGSWKNGFSSYAPYWVKRDYQRFPRIRIQGGKNIELLSAFGDASRDCEARAFRALMRHIKEVDGTAHTVVAMQVENEPGVLRDTRDRSPVANQAFKGPVPEQLTRYLQRRKDSLIPEFRDVWAQSGFKTSGSWEEIFGPGKPEDLDLPARKIGAEEGRIESKKLHWPVDEIFMAWHYAIYVDRVIQEGKAEYNIPMFVNAWLQQPSTAWPGAYPSGGPVPQVHDVWRAGAPGVDMLAPDVFSQDFDEVCELFGRNGNPLLFPGTGSNAANVLMAFGKYNAIGYSPYWHLRFSPFSMEGGVGPETPLAAAYRLISEMTPAIVAQQGGTAMTAVRLNPGSPPLKTRLGSYTLELSQTGGLPVPNLQETKAAAQGAAILIAAGPDEFYFGSIGPELRIGFTPSTPGPQAVGLGDVEEGRFEGGQWRVVRHLSGDDTKQGEVLMLQPNTILRVSVYRYE